MHAISHAVCDALDCSRYKESTLNVTNMRAPRKRLVMQAVMHLYAEQAADFLNALRLDERSPPGRTVHFSRLLH